MAQASVKITVDEESLRIALDALDEMTERAERINELVSELHNMDIVFASLFGVCAGSIGGIIIGIIIVLFM